MAIKRVFKNTMLNSQYLFKNGKAAAFVNGRYETAVADEIAQLEYEIEIGTPHIYVDTADYQVDTTLEDKIRDAMVKARLSTIAEYESGTELETETDATEPKSDNGQGLTPNPAETGIALLPSQPSANMATLLAARSSATTLNTPLSNS